jgi:hypothetical protein
VNFDVFEVGDADHLLEWAKRLPARGPEIRYLSELLRVGPARLTETRDLARLVLRFGDDFIPVVVNDGQESLCYLISPEVHYIRYMRDELSKIQGDRTARMVSAAVSAMGWIALPLGFNRLVSVNNWMLTTSQTVRLSEETLRDIAGYLSRRYPDFAVVFRGVDPRQAATKQAFESAGYELVLHRPVFESNAESRDATPNRRFTIRRDRRLLREPPLQVEIDAVLRSGEEFAIARLYRQLYLEKHSRFNVRYTPEFFRVAHDAGLERLITVRITGELVGFGTIRNDGDRLICALVGYDTRLDQRKLPVYRAVLAACLETAIAEQRVMFLSTGNAAFKRRRGGIEWFEYEAVYQRHLRPHRRLPWRMFRVAFERAKSGLDTSQI